jgi:hypothetical protein
VVAVWRVTRGISAEVASVLAEAFTVVASVSAVGSFSPQPEQSSSRGKRKIPRIVGKPTPEERDTSMNIAIGRH